MQRMSLVLWIACKKVELQSGLGLQSIAKSMRRQTSSGRCSAVSRSIHKSKTWVVQSRQRSFQWYLGFENQSTNDAAVPLTLAALSLWSIAKSMRRQTSSGRCSAVSRSIHKSKTCSFRAGTDLSNDILVLKIDWQMTLQCLWRCRAASVFDQSWNRCVGKLRANAVQPFLARFTKAKYVRLEQEKIFPAIYSVWKSTKKWRCSARLKLPAETGNRPVHDQSTTRSSSGFSSSPRQPRR